MWWLDFWSFVNLIPWPPSPPLLSPPPAPPIAPPRSTPSQDDHSVPSFLFLSIDKPGHSSQCPDLLLLYPGIPLKTGWCSLRR